MKRTPLCRVHRGDNQAKGIGDDDRRGIPAREASTSARASDEGIHRERNGKGAEMKR